MQKEERGNSGSEEDSKSPPPFTQARSCIHESEGESEYGRRERRGDGAVERKVEEDRRGCKDLPLITPLLATQNFFYVERER